MRNSHYSSYVPVIINVINSICFFLLKVDKRSNIVWGMLARAIPYMEVLSSRIRSRLANLVSAYFELSNLRSSEPSIVSDPFPFIWGSEGSRLFHIGIIFEYLSMRRK